MRLNVFFSIIKWYPCRLEVGFSAVRNGKNYESRAYYSLENSQFEHREILTSWEMAEKAKEFTEKGSEIYHGKPVGVDTDH